MTCVVRRVPELAELVDSLIIEYSKQPAESINTFESYWNFEVADVPNDTDARNRASLEMYWPKFLRGDLLTDRTIQKLQQRTPHINVYVNVLDSFIGFRGRDRLMVKKG